MLKLYFLQASRAIRTAWLLEELALEYEVDFQNRDSRGLAPDEKKKAVGGLGKSPALMLDDGTMLVESGAITEYLCEEYDKDNRLLPKESRLRAKVREWIHASEATFMTHGVAITYARWFGGELKADNPDKFDQFEEKLSINPQKDLDHLERSLKENASGFLVGDHLTAADIMMHFSASFMLARKLGTRGKTWPTIESWIEKCEKTESFRAAVQKTGYRL